MKTIYTQEEVIKKFNEIHECKYDYSKVIYKGITEKVCIICPEHGEFNQTARSHMRGSGCPQCEKSSTYKNKIKGNQKFIEESKLLHGNKYDYSKVIYKNNKEKVIIICPVHGEFLQSPIKHIKGQGCPKCYGNTKKTTEDFIKEAKEVHGTKYDYSKADYKNLNTKICIICSEHGEFWQTPKNHLKGQGCPLCAKRMIGFKGTKTFEEFVNEANKIHNNKYDYYKNYYKNTSSKIIILCPEHGEFIQNVSSHLQGCGCPKCGSKKSASIRRNNIYDLFYQSNMIHHNKYDYSKVKYTSMKTSVLINCPEHGLFKQTFDKHIYGKCGCPKCAPTYQPTTKEFIEYAKKVHNDKYDYSKVDYTNAHNKISINCPIHGEFIQQANLHIRGCGCPSCSHTISKSEIEIFDYITSIYNGEIVKNCRYILNNNKELDIYLPELNIAIEYNGMIWHSEKYNKDKNYHIDKLSECNKYGIKLIHIFETEYLTKKDIVLGKIKHLLKKDNDLEKIYARKCIVKEIDKKKAKEFLEMNHIQSYVASTIYLGCYYKDELIGTMSFKKEKDDNWELTRFATDITKRCMGVGGKLFSHFVKCYNPEEIKSFADRRWTLDKDNNLYTKLGFKLNKILKPDYRYTKGQNDYIHKFNFRKQNLLKKYPYILNKNMTEYEMTQKLGYYRIWDCGLFKFVWRK